MPKKEESPAKKHCKKRISRKILFWFLLINILVTTAATFWVYASMRDRLIDDKFEDLRSIRDLAKEHLLTNIHRHVDLAETIAKTPLIADVLLGNSSVENGSEYLRKIRSVHKGGIADLDGITISSTDDEAIGQNTADRRYFQKAMAGASGFAGPYEARSKPAAFHCIAYASVVKTGKTIGAIMLLSELERFSGILTSEGVQIGETGETYIVGIKPQPELDKMQMYTYKTMITTSRFDNSTTHITVDTEAINECIKGNSGVRMIKDYRGRSVLSAYAPISQGLGWCIISEIDEDEALSSAVRLRNQLILISIGVLAVVGTISVLVSRSITAPIRKLHKGSEEIGAGNLDYKIDIKTGDEIEQLADEFNLMSTKLKEFYSGLEEKVRERTEELEKANKGLKSEITKRKRAEAALQHRVEVEKLITRELEEKTEELSLSNQELNAFIYTIAHDVKAYAVSFQILSSLLVDDYGDDIDENGKMYIDRIQKNSEHLGMLIEDILELSRIGKAEDRDESVDISDVISSMADELASQLKERGTRLIVKDDMPAIKYDRTRMSQIFANLIGNANKFMGGDNEDPTIEVGYDSQDGYHTFYVRDNGIGIDEDYHEKIFQVLQRLNDIETEGTGVGLAIVKKVVENFGGEIWVDSAKGKGTTMYFTVPKADDAS